MVIALFILAVLGWAMLLRLWVGWLYTFGPSDGLLSGLYLLHAAVLAGVAVWLGWGLDEPGAATHWFVVLGAAAFVGLMAAYAWRWITRQRVPTRAEVHRFSPDMALGGLKGWAARLPGNELLSLRVVEYELWFERLPEAMDGKTLLHLTDTHFNDTPTRAYYAEAIRLANQKPADLIALTGDVMDHLETRDWLEDTLGQLDAPLGRYFILGNHDVDGAAERREALEALGWVDTAGRSVRVAGMEVGGSERPWMGERPTWAGEGFRLLLSHTPYEFNWARKAGVDLMLAGHLHGGHLRLPVVGCPNGAPYKHGVYRRGRTTLEVCAGLGQVTPLRYGCRPEAARLVLRRGV